jgi:CheY-like chemotaxis protein
MKKHLGDLLVEAGIITVKTLERALDRQRGSGKKLGIIFEEMGVITDEELVEALAKQFEFKTVKDISSHSFTTELLELIPLDFAVQKLVFPLKQKNEMLAIAISDPFDSDTIDYIGKKTRMKIVPVLATRKDLLSAIGKYYLNRESNSNNNQKVLVVDDSQSVLTIIKVALQKEGYNVMIANDGVEGLKIAFSQQPDLIICDSVMPRMDGYALMRSIKANPVTAGIPMILLTSKASPEEEHRALKSGFHDFIAKPVMPMRVISRVKKAIEIMQHIKS